MILCDTNVFIELFRKNILIRSELEKIGVGSTMLSDVVKMELFVGAKNKPELDAIRKYLNTLHTFPITSDISKTAVELVDEYCLSHKLFLADALIAATALHYNIELFTLNVKDFKFIPNLRLCRY